LLIDGECHCGNIALALNWPGTPRDIAARACTCSFCVQHGGVWVADANAELVVTLRDGALVSKYEFGTRTASFHVCSRCGVVPFVTSDIDHRLYAVVNVNVLVHLDPSSVRRSSATFDDEDLEARLLRRRRNWIGSVHVTVREF